MGILAFSHPNVFLRVSHTQVFESQLAGYSFYVLSPVFTVHWGVLRNKKAAKRPAWREQQNNRNRRLFVRKIKPEMLARHEAKEGPPVTVTELPPAQPEKLKDKVVKSRLMSPRQDASTKTTQVSSAPTKRPE